MPPRAKPPARRRGNRTKAPVARTLVVAASGLPGAPAHLGPAGLACWEQVWSAGAAFYVEGTDRRIITRLAELEDRRAGLLTVVGEHLVVAGSKGQPVVHPALRAIADLERQITMLEDRLGLNPTDRVRLGISEATRQSKLGELMQRQREMGR